MRMSGRLGLVTAAASGMGRAGAIRFAREGAAVAVVDIDAEGVARVVEEITGAGGTAIGLTGDLTDDDFSRAIVHDTAKAFGGLDFAWMHAGHPGPARVEGMDMEVWDLGVDLNLRTIAITTGEALPEMRKRSNGALLYTSSIAGIKGSDRSPAYSAMKFGVVGWTRSLAQRVAKDGIRANVICPGGVDTPMLRTFVARPDQDSTHNMDPEEIIATRRAGYPMGRPAQPDELANAAMFLLSSDASYFNGSALAVDGAMTA